MGEYNPEKPKGRKVAAYGILLTTALTIVLFGGALYLWYLGLDMVGPTPGPTHPQRLSQQDRGLVERFSSEREFSDWLDQADSLALSGYYAMPMALERGMAVQETLSFDGADVSVPSSVKVDSQTSGGMGGSTSAGRFSETNVQVTGIDEPDILKTDGQEIYYVPQGVFYRGVMPMMEEPMVFVEEDSVRSMPYYNRQPNVQAIRAFPVEELGLDAEIEANGDLLLQDGRLAVLSYDGVRTYDVSDPTQPTEAWDIDYQNGSWPVDARLKDGQLYLILASGIDRGRPCPYAPVVGSAGEVSIACRDIWHPVYPVPTDLTYTVLKVDFETGEVGRTASFVASQGSSTVYMSADNIYLTHVLPADAFAFVFGFLDGNADIVPAYVLDRLNKVNDYDLSQEAKSSEMRSVLGKWFQTLDQDDALELMNEMDNRIADYLKEHRRDLQMTGVVRLDVDRLEVRASGSVPGTLLNQFSMDEHDGHLRVATTSGETGGMFWQYGFGGGRSESVNDLYVLDSDLSLVGQALGMGLDERIYAVRFVGELGYVVTFRQTDPFYVLDLSNPRRPEIRGELKIPGYSSYLHPLREDLILGVGKEDNRVKISLFDVSDPDSPQELDRYSLSEYWSDILNTHHAFLLDSEHEVFFLPGGSGGYVMSYADDELKLAKAVSGLTARRAVYLDDYLYVAGDEELVVLDMNDWRRVDELSFR